MYRCVLVTLATPTVAHQAVEEDVQLGQRLNSQQGGQIDFHT